MKQFALIQVLLALLVTPSHGFVQPQPRITVERPQEVAKGLQQQHHGKLPPTSLTTSSQRTHSVACFGFNLPPGKKNDGLQDILFGAASVAGLILFFASPLGGLFFAAVNSVLFLAVLTPVLLIFAFNVWQFLNTTQGNCPSCGAPVRVLKDGSPSICFSCGSIVQASADGKGIDFAPNVDQFEQQDDSLFGSIFGSGDTMGMSSSRKPLQKPEEKEKQYRRERTVIDVDVEDVDK